ncbi:hypothetical protein DFH94DRAFT_764217 [Russula ochroleuca]|uniref:Crinkler (CRN) family protein n=1 Tax=Russula ochroleuca TaxID=152965 RepID=A0A9P5MQI7_9AGAM|nr:hypothetical protein DFH94DRAFT_764217 [Russula ochroleuca]
MTDNIDSIIHPKEKAMWEKVEDTSALAQLHRKFWLQGEYKDKLLGVHKDRVEEGEGAEEGEDTEEGEGAEEGEDTEEGEGAEEGDDDDDIGPECHILDIGIKDLEVKKFWVRKEYFRMYKQCEHHLETMRNEARPPSQIVTGQPGIGKSYWIFYALCRRLAEGKPIMWYRDSVMYLFVSDGVYKTTENPHSSLFKTRVWTLVDADGENIFPPSLAQHGIKYLHIFTTSPKWGRWKSLTKTTSCAIAIMNPWTRGEISAAAPIHGLAASSPAIDKMYSRFGPTPRICFDFPKMQSLLDWHEDKFESALSNLSSRTLQEMVNGARSLKFDDVSHTIVLMKRRGNDLSRALIIVEPITLVVEMALRNQLKKETQAERLALYRSLANVEAARRLAGVLQRQNPIELHLFPMIKKRPQGSGKGKKLPRWYSNHGDGVDPSSVQSINIRRTDNDVFSSMPNPIKDNIYYAPQSPNQVAFDSFIMDNKKLFIF